MTRNEHSGKEAKRNKQTGDRIARLASELLRNEARIPKRAIAHFWWDGSSHVPYPNRLTFGDVQRFAASLVSQGDGPEQTLAKLTSMSVKERRKFVAAFNSMSFPFKGSVLTQAADKPKGKKR